MHDVPECHGWWSPSDRRMEVSVTAVQLPAGVLENEAQCGTVCPTESTLSPPAFLIFLFTFAGLVFVLYSAMI